MAIKFELNKSYITSIPGIVRIVTTVRNSEQFSKIYSFLDIQEMKFFNIDVFL